MTTLGPFNWTPPQPAKKGFSVDGATAQTSTVAPIASGAQVDRRLVRELANFYDRATDLPAVIPHRMGADAWVNVRRLLSAMRAERDRKWPRSSRPRMIHLGKCLVGEWRIWQRERRAAS